MENASKALLIAGSVLIVILLIAMGVKVFNSTSSTTGEVETTMESTEIATFNNKFTAYLGNNKSASDAKSLANIVIANNAANSAYQVSFANETSAADISSTAASYFGKYNISASYSSDGRIKAIEVKSVSTTTTP